MFGLDNSATTTRGIVDACLLAVLSRGDSYGYAISQTMAGLLPMPESTLYPMLRRMEQSGHLSTYSVEHSGRLRKYYRVTPEGIRRLDEFRRGWAETKRMIDFIMEGVEA